MHLCHSTAWSLKFLEKKNKIAEPEMTGVMFFSLTQAPVWDANVWLFPAKWVTCLVGFMAVVKNNCFSEKFFCFLFFSPLSPCFFFFFQAPLYVYLVPFLLYLSRENQAFFFFLRSTYVFKYLLASLVTMTRTARRLCSVISSSGMTLTVAHSGSGDENQLSTLRCSRTLFAFFGEVGSSATGWRKPRKGTKVTGGC